MPDFYTFKRLGFSGQGHVWTDLKNSPLKTLITQLKDWFDDYNSHYLQLSLVLGEWSDN
jgi:hypothetical protein